MNKKGQWNIGVGAAFIIGGIYLLIKAQTEFLIAILGIVLIGIGIWLIAK